MIPRTAWYRQPYVKLAPSSDGRTVESVETRFLYVLAPSPALAILNLRQEPGFFRMLGDGFSREGKPVRLTKRTSDRDYAPAHRAIHRRIANKYLGQPYPRSV